MNSRMLIIPSIDVSRRKVVRIKRHELAGSIESFTPVEAAKYWEREGAERLHLIDIDGAKEGRLVNLDIIWEITSNIEIPVQVGGGVRTPNDVRKLAKIGASAVIYRPRPLVDPRKLGEFRKFPNLIIAVDILEDGTPRGYDGKVEVSELGRWIGEVLYRSMSRGVLITDVAVEGLETGPRIELLESIVEEIYGYLDTGTDGFGYMSRDIKEIIYAGGVSEIEDLMELSSIGFTGCVIGSALYSGKLNLMEVMKYV